MSEETIWIVTDETPQTSIPGQKGSVIDWSAETKRELLPKGRKPRGVRVGVDKLEREMTRFLQSIGRLFKRAEAQTNKDSGMRLDEIELSVEINGEGEVKLLGSGGKVGGKGAITLKFKRADSKS